MEGCMNPHAALFAHFNPETGLIDGVQGISRRLSDLKGAFTDNVAYDRALQTDNPVVYTVSTITPEEGEGALHYGVGVLFPGTIGHEYFLTRGHLHAWRAAAEVYIGLRGEGKMLLEDETSGTTTVLDLNANTTVYVPGNTAHRTANVGTEPLVYIGIYPAAAGHDYGKIAKQNFRSVIVRKGGKPVVMSREKYLLALPQMDADGTKSNGLE